MYVHVHVHVHVHVWVWVGGCGWVYVGGECNVQPAPRLSQAADVTVLVLGTDLSVAREGHDAVDLTFSSGQVPAACLPWACHVPAMHVTAM